MKSILNQDFQGKLETIVVDSNSPDNTKRIARKYSNKVINVKTRGVSKARNLGAKHAKGELLLFLDADTVLDPGFVVDMYEKLTEPKVVCISGTVGGLERRSIFEYLFKLLHYKLMNTVSALTAQMGFPFFPTVCCACKKTAFDEIGGFDEGLAVAEDLVFSLRMGRVGKCLVAKGAKAYTSVRRVRKNGLLRNYMMYFKNYFRVFILNQKPWIHDFPHTREI